MIRIIPIASNSTQNLVIADEVNAFAFSADATDATRKGIVTKFHSNVGAVAIFYDVERQSVCMPSVIIGPVQSDDGRTRLIPRDSIWPGEWAGLFSITNLTTPERCLPKDEAENILGVGKLGFRAGNQMPFEVEEEVFEELLRAILG